jgi:hypothetical protein
LGKKGRGAGCGKAMGVNVETGGINDVDAVAVNKKKAKNNEDGDVVGGGRVGGGGCDGGGGGG